MFCHEKWIQTTISNSNFFATSILELLFFPPNSKISLTSNFTRKLLHTQHFIKNELALRRTIIIIIVPLNANYTKGKNCTSPQKENQLSTIEVHLSPQYFFGSQHLRPFLKHITHLLFFPNAKFLSDSKLRRSKACLVS